ncbi:MAG: GNAT family N-acetyltransferase [Lewinellaceae bacterium]|nr:GNAT family N-acetyltransferase [Saprospiraceae bacterium]MCB9337045.1 GNAT family N-acetyltransferase [Lewinellaceae bacterium]
MKIEITEANGSKQKRRFIDFPHDLYEGDPNYVPEIYIGQKELLDEKKNPFFQHSKAQLYLAIRDGKVVGRIAAIRNNEYNRYANANVGYFGFFDVVEDYEVAKQLFDTACAWAKKEGLDAVLGPTNFSTNDTAALLVEGFDRPPVIMMTYNKPYYKDFLERYGFVKKMDMLAYFTNEEMVNMKSVRLAQMIEERLAKKGITFRPANMKKFREEIKKVSEVYKAAWDKNWGFVPPTDEEFKHMADEMKMVIDPEFALLAEHEGRLVAFALAVPDINVITRTIKKGRLLPTGIFKLLFQKKKIKRLRIILLGVREEYRKMGIEGVFYARIISRGIEKGFNEAEASWILDNNEMMKKGVEGVNMVPYKRYRIYEKTLNG